MQKIKRYLEIIAFTAIAIFMCVIFVELIFDADEGSKWREEPFEVRLNGEYFGKFMVSGGVLPSVQAGDEVVFSKKVTKRDYENTDLVFRTYGSAVEVYVSGKYLYSYGEELYEKGSILGRGYHIVRVTGIEGYAPYLEIKFKPAEKMSYLWVDFLRFNDGSTIWRDIIKQDLLAIMLSILLLVIGMTGYIISLIAHLRQKTGSYYPIYAFATAFFVGLWNICAFSFFQFMTDDYESSSILEYASLYMAGFTYLLTIELIQKNTKYIKAIRIVRNIYIGFVVIIFMLHITNILWVSQTVKWFRCLIGIVMIGVAIMFMIDYKKQDRYERILTMCNAFAIILAILQMLLLNMGVTIITIGDKNLQAGNVFTIIALVALVVAPILSYMLKVFEIDKYERQITVYKEIAHKDQMTGLENRYGGIAFVLEIQKNKDPYSLIMYDLNNLKMVNDTYGHDAGDKLIKDFANCIKEVFSQDEYVNVRYGGDEFITIAKILDKNILSEKLEELKNCIDEENLSYESSWKISFAYGMSSSNEIPDADYDGILSLADARMYENKTKSRGGRAVVITNDLPSLE